jgi:hypothetical protein
MDHLEQTVAEIQLQEGDKIVSKNHYAFDFYYFTPTDFICDEGIVPVKTNSGYIDFFDVREIDIVSTIAAMQ